MKKTNTRFQLSVDTDSVFISQAPDSKKSRVILTNLEHQQLHNIAKSIIDAELKDQLIEILEEG